MQSHVYSVYMYSKFFKLITIFSSLTDISQYMEQNGHSAKDFHSLGLDGYILVLLIAYFSTLI